MDPSTEPGASPASPTDMKIPEQLFSPKSTPETITEANKLLTLTKRPWNLTHSPPGLQRRFKFRNFTVTMNFWNTVVNEIKLQKHHPEWANMCNELEIRWTTHRPRCISAKDVHMAKFCDKTAEALGEVDLDSVPEKKDTSQASAAVQEDIRSASAKERKLQKTSDGNSSEPGIPYKSEIAHPGTPPNKPSAEPGLLASLLGVEEHTCTTCHAGKEKYKTTGTESGSGNTKIQTKYLSPHLESTEGKSIVEEIKKRKDELELAKPGLGGPGEDLKDAVEKEKEGKE